MLRHFDHPGGIGVYTRNLVDHLLKIDRDNRYVLIYNDSKYLGLHGSHPNVEELVLSVQSKLLWDQIGVPWIAYQRGLDILFNPKMSVPLIGPCKKVFQFAGADWIVLPKIYKWHDRVYHRIFAPLYCSAADAVISISKDATRHIEKRMPFITDKLNLIYLGISSDFKKVSNHDVLRNVREKYNLPERFILFVGQFYPMKNLGRLITAFSLLIKRWPIKMIMVGKPRWGYASDLDLIKTYGLEKDVFLTGWVPDEDLPALYSLADLFAFPSLYEGFGIPLLEAMACGCPIVTSRAGSPPEVVEDAAVLVDPMDPKSIEEGLYKALTDNKLRRELTQKGFERVKSFSWESCAKETLTLFESLNGENA